MINLCALPVSSQEQEQESRDNFLPASGMQHISGGVSATCQLIHLVICTLQFHLWHISSIITWMISIVLISVIAELELTVARQCRTSFLHILLNIHRRLIRHTVHHAVVRIQCSLCRSLTSTANCAKRYQDKKRQACKGTKPYPRKDTGVGSGIDIVGIKCRCCCCLPIRR